MFFWKNSETKNANQKASLQTCHRQIDPKSSDRKLNPKRIKRILFKRTFSFAPSFLKASMCVEASLSFTFFLLFLIQVFSMLLIFKGYTKDMGELQQKGKKMAAYAFAAEGFQGTNEELIRLHNSRKTEVAFLIFPVPDCRIRTKCVVKPWTGYDVRYGKNRTEEETLVYMTRYGTVYHKDRSCSHLALSIQGVEMSQLREIRNESGGIYLPCERCGDNGFVTVVFVTDYGDRYHTSLNCQGLKRYIRSVPLSQLEGVSPCKKCGE